MNVNFHRWETWGSLTFMAIATAMETEWIPTTGTWHKAALTVLTILGALGFGIGRQMLGRSPAIDAPPTPSVPIDDGPPPVLPVPVVPVPVVVVEPPAATTPPQVHAVPPPKVLP